MPPTIRNDPDRPSGGYALLEGPNLAGIAAVTIQDMGEGLFLSAGGRWARLPHAFPVEPAGEALRLGPAVVDHVPEEMQVALRSADGRDLGRLFWVDVMPTIGRTVAVLPPPAEPTPPPPPPPVVAPGAAVAPPPQPPLPPEPLRAITEPLPVPVVRRVPRAALAGAVLAALVAAGGAWALLRGRAPDPTQPPAPRQATRCADDFGPKTAAARAGSDDDRVKVAEAALAGGCGAQALAALDGADWEMSEPAAWHLARFYDPNETDPTVRAAETPHPDWAATYYAHWAGRVPREAAALKQLCTTDGAALDANAQLKRACGR